MGREAGREAGREVGSEARSEARSEAWSEARSEAGEGGEAGSEAGSYTSSIYIYSTITYLIPSKFSMCSPRFSLRTLRRVVPEFGVMSKPAMSDMSFQWRDLSPGLQSTEMVGMYSCNSEIGLYNNSV